MEQDGRRDVVGKIAHDAQLAGAERSRQLREVGIEHVGLDHRQLAVQAQAGREVAIEFDHRQLSEPLHQRLRQRGQARPDFHHRLARPRIDQPHDRVDDGLIDQEVLAEAFAGDVF